MIEVPAVKVGARLFRIDPAGLTGTWRIDVFGYGTEGADAVASVLWRTPSDGTMPKPTATGSLFTMTDGRRTAPYGGPEIHLRDLATTPRVASGTWTVTDDNGATVSVPLTRTKSTCERAGASHSPEPSSRPASPPR